MLTLFWKEGKVVEMPGWFSAGDMALVGNRRLLNIPTVCVQNTGISAVSIGTWRPNTSKHASWCRMRVDELPGEFKAYLLIAGYT